MAHDANRLSYNGVVFDPVVSRVSISAEFIKDEAARTMIYHKYTVIIRTIVAEDDGTGDTLETVRRRLAYQGGQLWITGTGFGDLIVNVPVHNGHWDLKWGPKAEILEWSPIGASRACEVVWRCTTCINMCSTQPNRYGILAFNYEVAYSFDSGGLTSRTITGYIEIAQTRIGRTVPKSADAYREIVKPTVPVGYQRTSQNWRVSKDKSRLDFTVSDRQLATPNPYPSGVVEINARHAVRWGRQGGEAARTRNTINCTVTLLQGTPQKLAYKIFLDLVRTRVLHVTRKTDKGLMLDTVSIEENIFGNSVTFSAGYRIFHSLKDLLDITGLWTPIGTDWRYWHLSMGDAFSQRGLSKLRHLPGHDAIVDICGGSFTLTDQPQTEPNQQQPKLRTLRNEQPPVKNSWLKYESWLEVYRDKKLARQSILQESDHDAQQFDIHNTGGIQYDPAQGYDDVLQSGGRSSYLARLIGSAQRAGYEIPRPVVLKIGDQRAVEIYGRMVQRKTGTFLGVPVYSAAWDIWYAIPNSPGKVPLLKIID